MMGIINGSLTIILSTQGEKYVRMVFSLLLIIKEIILTSLINFNL